MQNKELKIVRFVKKVPGHTVGKVIKADPREIYKLIKSGVVQRATEEELSQYVAKLQASSVLETRRPIDPGPEKGKMLYGENGKADCPECKDKKTGCPECEEKAKARAKAAKTKAAKNVKKK